jgi:hypothetical protein
MIPVHVGAGPILRHGPGGFRTIAAAVGLLAVCPVHAAQDRPRAPEYQIKAAFLYNFMLYTEWPPSAFEKNDSPIVLAIAGEDPFGNQLDAAVRGKTVRGRAIDVHRYDQMSEVSACHLLFVSVDQSKNFPLFLQRHRELSLLSVGESEDFTRAGGVIQFVIEENKVRFEVNTDAADRAHLKLSSKLLSLAKIVRDSGAPKDR